ncbi:MAG TPA: hypothetical protein EYN38_08745 [Flavobacteriales bacterium]|nr:hypothetical protein [Flavobacteriales bacterium]HIA11087.1 hypothetical protein [Flavobacteriales bacterium]HIO73171.1 hypothetical protein [Flavobacteriales bacterium]
MKNLLILLFIPVIFLFVKCGSGDGGAEGEDREKPAEPTVNIGNTIELNLAKWGYHLTIQVPAPGETVPEAIVEELEWGGLEIRVGTGFQLQLGGGEGDIAQRKADINLDDVYEATFTVDDEAGLFYSQKFKGTDMEGNFHFFVVIKDGDVFYEIEDIKEATFGEGQARRMFEIAKAIKINSPS